MATNLYYPPTQNGLQKTLGAGLDTGVTASATLNNVTGIPNKPGVVVINRIDSNNAELSASVREWISYSGTSGSTITTLTRGLGGSTDQDHAVGSVVEFIFDITVLQAILDKLDGTDTTALEDTNGNEMLETSTTASAVNNLLIKNAATGNNPVIAANGEADTGITFENDQGEEILILDANATAVNEVTIDNAATGSNPVISATGDDTNIGLELTPKGSGVVDAKVGLKVAGSTVSVNDILDEDDMSSDSATALATQQSIKAYVDANASSRQSATGTFNRDLTAASGNVSYTGVGFTPTELYVSGVLSSICISNGFSNSSRAEQCVFSAMSAAYTQGGVSANVTLIVSASNAFQTAQVNSYDSDGFTLTWSKTNSPTGTANFVYMALG